MARDPRVQSIITNRENLGLLDCACAGRYIRGALIRLDEAGSDTALSKDPTRSRGRETDPFLELSEQHAIVAIVWLRDMSPAEELAVVERVRSGTLQSCQGIGRLSSTPSSVLTSQMLDV
jgi:hypothetical protein